MIISIIGAIVVVLIIFVCIGVANIDPFEQRFIENFGRSPEQFIKEKLNNGSRIDAIEYLYDINAAKIYHDYGLEPRPFDYYYKKINPTYNEFKESVEFNSTQYEFNRNNEVKQNSPKKSIIKTLELKDNISLFEKIFFQNYDEYPEKYISQMMSKGYSKKEILKYYDLRCTAISEYAKVQPQPFSYYYNMVERGVLRNFEHEIKNIKEIKGCRGQLMSSIDGISFGKYFYNELNDIFSDEEFYKSIERISNSYKKIEFAFDDINEQYRNFKYKVLPDLFFQYNLDTTRAFKNIETKVTRAGYSATSAIITVYYLVRMLQLFNLSYEKRTVEGLSEVIKKLEQ